MQSPFPGMDPFLEDHAIWADFHHTFVSVLSETIGNKLPNSYDARINQSVVKMTPEMFKFSCAALAPNRKFAAGTIEFLDDLRQAYIEIRHRPDRSLVTVLELLSPFNKTGDGSDQYRAKRMAILGQKINLVELDLLLGGTRPTLREPLPSGDYYVYLTREKNRTNCEVYAWKLRDPLPTIPVPLRVPDADIHVDLAEVFRDTYRRGRYARELRYGERPTAPMGEGDLAWALGQRVSV